MRVSPVHLTLYVHETCRFTSRWEGMSDSESSTDSEDFEYIPEECDGRSDSEASVGGEEEGKRGVSTASTVGTKGRSTRKSTHQTSPTRKNRGISAHADAVDAEEEGRGEGEDKKQEGEKKEKARVDDLWASFKKDTTVKMTKGDVLKEDTSLLKGKDDDSSPAKIERKMVKIQETYDFAGDEVTVEREVAADSKEAKQSSLTPSSSSNKPQSSPSSMIYGVKKSTNASSTVSLLAGKRNPGISSVLQSLSKKPKMSTLEKSQLDWNRFKSDEGLEHELSQQRKDSYLEKQEFLQRTDRRQYELEREERLKKYRRLH